MSTESATRCSHSTTFMANSNNHNYTTNKEEHDNLVSLGWVDEGYPEYVAELLGANPNIPERRVQTVANQVRKNIDILLRIAK